MKQKSQLY